MLLEIEDLKVYYRSKKGTVKAVDGVSLRIDRGEMVGIVGESGCGKSTLAYSIIRLVQGEVRGKILFDGVNLLELSEEKMRRIRGKEIGMVFQDPMTSLDPLEKIGDQIVETITEHENVDEETAMRRARELLLKVGLPEDRVESYPHQLSGGQRQRVMIALAIALNPKLLIADEPTTALDVIVQERIMDILEGIKREGKSVILITHDLALASERCDRIAVMYAGWLVEMGKTSEIVKDPLHPYTKGLMDSIPDLWMKKEVKPMPGNPPDLTDPPKGCRFHPRCPLADDVCRREEPPTVNLGDRIVRCWRWANASEG